MTTPLRRAGGFAAVGTLSLAAAPLGVGIAVAFGAVAAVAFLVDDGPLFELFARVGDREDGRLNGLLGFSLAAAGLSLFATAPQFSRETGAPLPVYAFVAGVLVLGYGNLGERLVQTVRDDPFLSAAGFTVVGFLAAFLGQLVVSTVGRVAGIDAGAGAGPVVTVTVADAAFLAAAGALTAALLRSMLFERDDPLVMLSVGLLLWFLSYLPTNVTTTGVAVALAVTVGLGIVSYVLQTASIEGMLTGVLLSLLTIVLGGVGWFAVLITFFAVGGLSTKFRYDAKLSRGVAEENEGARGTGNVLGNSAVALAAVLAYAASAGLPVDATLFLFAFAGSLAAAMSDTLSSEIGGLFDTPRLITSLERVEPGTDGGVTWQGELAGVAGAALVALIAFALFERVDLLGAGVVLVGGVVGMTVDSLLGALVEGDRVGNEAVNFLATLAGAVAATLVALFVVVP
ncbi:DUF92 domain-containing protein [Halobium salinum]|uniref:DUF92 domain-containing protein n=1 Tax=Halobium salinum TaxID=1364940 RepID=A0ABD5P8U6_9EURY|nr:DUF92 domain-containing protein [Halobium salinum]